MDTSIQFADADAHPVQPHSSIGGVYPLRSRSHTRPKKSSVDAKISELEEAEDEDAGLRDERDFKRSQVCCA